MKWKIKTKKKREEKEWEDELKWSQKEERARKEEKKERKKKKKQEGESRGKRMRKEKLIFTSSHPILKLFRSLSFLKNVVTYSWLTWDMEVTKCCVLYLWVQFDALHAIVSIGQFLRFLSHAVIQCLHGC